jgi:hypothetical protein
VAAGGRFARLAQQQFIAAETDTQPAAAK